MGVATRYGTPRLPYKVSMEGHPGGTCQALMAIFGAGVRRAVSLPLVARPRRPFPIRRTVSFA